ncbi:MAG: YjbQ family protein [Candidatus Margulisiibacteriota bacterium]|nr:MAG: hypothetical protein A2X43_13045 [Candidatus Margulisbacteria bacterium GWD2_39_127]OGI01103.1 MAG: hypothetical protein A2X42_06785 [Candidatus Margulisbacteria bacterium GWF2_38_17]OGI07352.1 MAG: hypothetical protein A2X41_08575 [Candidatus Margulisbacteria bacterium GWE2_39_32]PZM80068.1 MAG: YjbQ family protein [Candidatus Margulisiibacteriota bacterium]HAR62861.1 hypothetical protein [Candidatus Margulisiibacteriota bacterium]
MEKLTIKIETNKKEELINITRQVQDLISENDIENGIAILFVPHTTAGITITENADPDVTRDIIVGLRRAFPNEGFLHMEGNSDAHIKSTITNFSQTLIIENGKLVLGTWQGIYFCEYDGPRIRKVYVKILPDG